MLDGLEFTKFEISFNWAQIALQSQENIADESEVLPEF